MQRGDTLFYFSVVDFLLVNKEAFSRLNFYFIVFHFFCLLYLGFIYNLKKNFIKIVYQVCDIYVTDLCSGQVILHVFVLCNLSFICKILQVP